MHSGQLADPMNGFTKALKKVSGKRMKTEADFEELARIEYLGGLYVGADGEPIIPADAIEAMLVEAFKKSKQGKTAKAGVYVTKDAKLQYTGPKTPDTLWADPKHRFVKAVRVGTAKVMRTRPIFPEWSAEIEVHYLDDVIDKSAVADAVNVAGRLVGLLEWRPKFGRFDAKAI
jgi:hypothetical protein